MRTTMTERTKVVGQLGEDFKKVLKDEIAKVKDSNKALIATFKTFDEGGTFSPEEVTNLSRRVDKANLKVITIEGRFETELDELVAKQTDQAMDLHFRVEEKLKSHLIDVVFIEQCQRWLTNTQVKIRAVVAKCNGQASDVRISTEKLQSILLTNEKSDEHLVEIKENFEFVMKLLQDRTDLLSCRKDSGKEIEELASLKNAAVSNLRQTVMSPILDRKASTDSLESSSSSVSIFFFKTWVGSGKLT